MIEGLYLSVTTRSRELVCSGKIINHKYDLSRNIYLYSTDNKYFFSKQSKNLIIQTAYDELDYVAFKPESFSNLVILPWKDREQEADVYIENTIFELDEEIKDLVYAINLASYETKGSCSGHNEGPAWVSIAFYDLQSLIRLCSLIRTRFKKDDVNLEVPSEFCHDSIFVLNLTISMKEGKTNLALIAELTAFFLALS